MLLIGWLPQEALDGEYANDGFNKHLNETVVKDYGVGGEEFETHPFKHKFIHNWCTLSNGYAVGWNENPSIGWSFPVKKLNKGK